MTTIAYKDGILAGDKQANDNGTIGKVTKVYRVGNALLGFSGNLTSGLAMRKWLEEGGDFPESQKDKEQWARCMVIRDGRIFVYENSPIPFEVEDSYHAIGSGREFAIMAMRLGKTAAEAVELTMEFDPETGKGVDILASERP